MPEEDVGHAERADDEEDLRGAVERRGEKEHLGERRVKRELDHLGAEGAEVAAVGQRAEDPELVHGVEDVLLGRRVHEAEVEEVVDAEGPASAGAGSGRARASRSGAANAGGRLQEEDDVAEVGALDLGNLRREQLVPELALGVEPVAEPRPGAAGATAALVGVGAAHGRDLERVHADARVIDLRDARAGRLGEGGGRAAGGGARP